MAIPANDATFRPATRPFWVLLVGLGAAAGAICVTLLNHVVRAFFGLSGPCPETGLDASAASCPDGTGWAALLPAFLAVSLIATIVGGRRSGVGVGVPLQLLWSALFLAPAWQLIHYGLFPPVGHDTTAVVVTGVLCVLMGALPFPSWLVALWRGDPPEPERRRAGHVAILEGSDR